MASVLGRSLLFITTPILRFRNPCHILLAKCIYICYNMGRRSQNPNMRADHFARGGFYEIRNFWVGQSVCADAKFLHYVLLGMHYMRLSPAMQLFQDRNIGMQLILF